MRFVLRSAVRNPGFSALVLLSLAAGIGLTAALASIADAILYRPLPVLRPEEIVRLYTASANQSLGFVSYPDFEDFQAASRTLTRVVAQSQVLIALGGEGEASPRVRMGLAVTENYFDVLGVRMALGRGFISDQPEVVLGYAFWESAHGGDRGIVGQVIRVGGAALTVAGVAPKEFGLDRFLHEDFYVPIAAYRAGLLPSTGRPLEDRTRRYLSVYGRLARGATIEQARAELTTLGARLESAHSETNRGCRAIVLTEFQARMRADRTMPILAGLALAVGALMLAIACASVTGLFLMRGETRTRETAIRVALGASRGRLLIESVTESLMLAASGAALAIPVAWGVERVLEISARLPADLPFSLTFRIDFRVVVVAAIICMLGRIEPKISLGGSRTRVMDTLVTIEIALVATLVASVGSVLSGVAAATKIDLGYRTDHVLVMALDPSQTRYAEGRTRTFYRELLNRVSALPGVRAAALAQSVPLGYSSAQREIAIEDHPRLSIWMNIVSPDYFGLMRMPMVEGRGFDERDTETSEPVMVVNQTLAKLVNGAGVHLNGRKVEVIGVVPTAKYFQLTEAARPYFYLPYSQNFASRMFLHVETEGDPAEAAPSVLREVGASQPVSEVRALRDYSTKGAMLSARVAAEVLGGVGSGGLLLALVGLYGVVASAAERRRREIGIRIALGASRFSVVMLMLRQGMKLVAIGTVCGLAAALGASRFLASLVAGAGKPDAWVLGKAALLVATASLAACLIPACRAVCLDSPVSLRES